MATPQGPAPTPPALVGREREQALLRDHLAAALAGHGGLVLLGGEAGVGKTALAEWLLAAARAQGALVLIGRCYDLTETPPYGPWDEAFARAPRGEDQPAAPDLTGGGVTSQAALFAAVRDHLAALAAGQPLVLLLDDLHWADPASLDLLRYLGRGIADLPLLLLATYRADELTRRHPLYTLLPTLEREARSQRLDLRPLGEPGIRALVSRYALPGTDAARLVAWLLGRAEGNAFFTAQLLRALEEEGVLRPTGDAWAINDLAGVGLPLPLRQVLDARLARLDGDHLRLLTLAAVIGQEVPLPLWAAVAGTDEDGLLDTIDAAAEAQLVAVLPDGAAVRFAHALIREALYAGTLATRRRRVHLRVGAALLAAADPDPDAVAYHFRQAGDPRAADWLVRAGERAQAAFAWLAAADRFEAALALLERDAAQAVRRAQLHSRLALLRRFADPRAGVAHLDEALRLMVGAGDPPAHAHLTYARGLLRGLGGDLSGGVAEMQAGAAALAETDAAARARLAAEWNPGGLGYDPARGPAILAEWLAMAGRLAEARDLGERFLTALARVPTAPGGRDAALVDTHRSLGTTYFWLGQPERARAESRRARDAAGTDYLRIAQAAGTEWLLGRPYYADRLANQALLSDTYCENIARVGETSTGDAREMHDATRALFDGRWAEARPQLVTGSRTGPAQWRALTAEILAPLLSAQGDQDLAAALTREWLPDGPDALPGTTFCFTALALQRMAAGFAREAGDLPRARAWLAAHDRWLAWSGAVYGLVAGALGWAAYHGAAGDPAQARRSADRALAYAADPRQPLGLLAAHRALGALDTAEGRHAGAADHLAEALALAEACAAPYERALTLLARAELHLASADRDGAQTALTEARVLLEPLEARPALARAARLAATVPAPAYPADLSAREVEVLRLVAQGLSNAQAAARLFLSPRTIDQHLRAIYGKLGVNSRAAATAFAIDHGLR